MASFDNLAIGYSTVSTSGGPIAVAGTATGSATTVHTIPDGNEEIISITATNINSTDETVVLLIGGTSDVNKVINVVPATSTRLILNRHTLKANGAAIVISVYSTTTNKVNVLVERLIKSTTTTA